MKMCNLEIKKFYQLAGIIEPNDCKCHLDNEGFYTHSLLQDYPSISQVKIFFVRTEKQITTQADVYTSIPGLFLLDQ